MVDFKREIPIRHDVDIFVAGGGPAGLAAAVTAARQGKKVFLAEGHSCFGGMGTAGLIPVFMEFTDGVNFLAGGFGKEVYDRLAEAHLPNPRMIQVELLKRIYDQMVVECGANFSFMTQLVAVEKENDEVTTAILAGKSGLFGIKAKVFIDCTGDGDLAAWAGAAFAKGDENGKMMPGTLCSQWAGINWDVARHTRQAARLKDAFKDKIFTVEDRHHTGMNQTGRHLGGANMSHTFGVDGTDERTITRSLVESRKIVAEYERYYREYLEGFENAELVITGSLLGIRESRRITGDYVLSLDDFNKRASFDDEIGRYAYPVDIHPASTNKADFEKSIREFQTMRYQKGENYGISYRSLIVKGLKNVLVAGRCISADRYMQSSIRVMPCCFITGQGAGMAAALAVAGSTDIRNVNIHQLQSSLKKIGAFLPNSKS
jgi:hypothetical protein